MIKMLRVNNCNETHSLTQKLLTRVMAFTKRSNHIHKAIIPEYDGLETIHQVL